MVPQTQRGPHRVSRIRLACSRNPRSSHIWLLYSYTLYACRRYISNPRIGLWSVDLRFEDSEHPLWLPIPYFCVLPGPSKALCVLLILRMAGRVDSQDEILPYLYEPEPELEVDASADGTQDESSPGSVSPPELDEDRLGNTEWCTCEHCSATWPLSKSVSAVKKWTVWGTKWTTFNALRRTQHYAL